MSGIEPSSPFYHARLRVEWANHRARDFQAMWQAHTKSDFARLVIEDKPNGRGQFIKLVANGVPHQLGMLLGEAVHGYRASLDYAANQLVSGSKRLSFPFAETREALVATFADAGGNACPVCGRGSKKGGNVIIETAVPGISSVIIDSIQPYKAGSRILWLLTKLDNADKHRIIVPMYGFNEISGINATDSDGNRIVDGSIATFLGNESVGFGMGFGLKIQKYDKPTAEPLFHEAGLIEGEPVIPFLAQCSQLVSKAIDSLEDFVSERRA